MFVGGRMLLDSAPLRARIPPRSADNSILGNFLAQFACGGIGRIGFPLARRRLTKRANSHLKAKAESAHPDEYRRAMKKYSYDGDY